MKIPWSREQAIASVDQFLDDGLPGDGPLEDGGIEKTNRGRILELADFEKTNGPQARLWGAGFMLAFYARWADDARAYRVFRIIEKNYGPMPRQHWVGSDSNYKDKGACYPRHNAHVLYGMAIAAYQ